MVIRSFAYRKPFEHVLDHCDFLIEIPRFFTNVMPKSKHPQRPQERSLRLGPWVFIIARHRKCTPGCLSLEMDRSVSKHVKLWRTWDNKSKLPSVWMLLFGASNQTRESLRGILIVKLGPINKISSEILISSVHWQRPAIGLECRCLSRTWNIADDSSR